MPRNKKPYNNGLTNSVENIKKWQELLQERKMTDKY